jgi:hypothetical protein
MGQSMDIRLISMSLLITLFQQSYATEHIIFIHGTVFPGITALTNPIDITISQQVDTSSCYRQTLSAVRKDPYFFESQVIYTIGMHEITVPPIETCQHYAIHQIAYAFDKLLPHNKQYTYHAFGWLGELTIEGRKTAAQKLYQELITLKKAEDTLTLISHSHGGNVIAYLAQEEALHKKGLVVEQAYLLATPIQPETIHLFTDKLFQQVISLYSKKDTIQISDNISTPSRKSHRRLDHYLKHQVNNRLLDIEVTVHDKSIFGHRAFFYFNQVHIPALEAFFTSHHFTLSLFKPLPLAALIPMLQTLLPHIDHETRHARADLWSSDHDWRLHLIDAHQCYRTQNYYTVLQKIQAYITQTWLPRACSNEIKRNICAAGTALKHRFGLTETAVCYP